MERTEWTGCYDESWKGMISDEAFSHPAKMSKGLCERIFKHLIEKGWLVPGESVCIDPFGGIGTTGIVGASHGIKVLCCELETRFVDLARGYRCPGNYWPKGMGHVCSECAADKGRSESHHCQGNFEIHRAMWEACGDPLPEMYCGDSRRLCEVLGPVLADVAVSSPPYAESVNAQSHGIDWSKAGPATGNRKREGSKCDETLRDQLKYADCTPGQLGAMPPGDLAAAIVGSPPFLGQVDGGGIKRTGLNIEGQSGAALKPGDRTYSLDNTGQTTGNLAAMPEGNLADSIVSSPPYEGSLAGCEGAVAPHDSKGTLQSQYKERAVGSQYADVATRKRLPDGTWPRQREPEFYDNLGVNTGETFWQASAQILQQCYDILRPGGIACFVLKAFVRKGEIVDFPGDWQRLCEATGFQTVEVIHASLVKKNEHPGLFGEPVVKEKKRASFFRRLHEKRYPHLAIDCEIVLIMRKGEA